MTTPFLIIAIIYVVSCLICYAKGVKDGREDATEELENKYKYVGSRQRHSLMFKGEKEAA